VLPSAIARRSIHMTRPIANIRKHFVESGIVISRQRTLSEVKLPGRVDEARDDQWQSPTYLVGVSSNRALSHMSTKFISFTLNTHELDAVDFIVLVIEAELGVLWALNAVVMHRETSHRSAIRWSHNHDALEVLELPSPLM
jgi:hypothetical protein